MTRRGTLRATEVLRKAAASISSRVRLDDLAARLGGDEFVVICPETSTASAQELARSLEECLAEASIRSSIGVAEREAEDDGLPEYLVARADASMYQHNNGRVAVVNVGRARSSLQAHWQAWRERKGVHF